MKLKCELDITAEEALELFEGNTENLQKAMVAFFIKSMSESKKNDNEAMRFWQLMAEKSGDMFDQYAKMMTPKTK
ncbi:hypothetical protein TDB9533_04398 [Thalassocella blandensis]|nr:hypothetical protein TDB9533_04398 [Thalassocella blandensis]